MAAMRQVGTERSGRWRSSARSGAEIASGRTALPGSVATRSRRHGPTSAAGARARATSKSPPVHELGGFPPWPRPKRVRAAPGAVRHERSGLVISGSRRLRRQTPLSSCVPAPAGHRLGGGWPARLPCSHRRRSPRAHRLIKRSWQSRKGTAATAGLSLLGSRHLPGRRQRGESSRGMRL